MPLIRQTPTNIVVNVSDKTVGSTIIKRKAEVLNLNYAPREERVIISLNIIPFAAIPDPSTSGETTTYGESLDGVVGFTTYQKNIIADMTTLVDVTNGVPFASANMIFDSTATGPGGILEGKTYMYEYEFYKMMAATQSVIVDDLITSIIARADADGRI
jgi:hypothetical protein